MGGLWKGCKGKKVLKPMRRGEVRRDLCVFLCIKVYVCVFACVFMDIRVYSQAIAIAVREGRFGQPHHSGAAFANDFWGTAQQLLGFCERFSQLFLPLHELRVALQTRREREGEKEREKKITASASFFFSPH